ncbi:MAG: hypothetical protein ND866_07130 [Pyrinomonadaceae bacterium]|nr:hypothetical protein [Pyrinomonadaceae bacterium]
MVTPPVVADLPTEVAAGMVERGGGLLDDDVTVTVAGTCFMIKAPL